MKTLRVGGYHCFNDEVMGWCVLLCTIVSVMKLSGVTGPGSRMMEEDEEVNWFDKDLDDFDIPTADNREDEEAEEDLGEWHWSEQAYSLAINSILVGANL